MNHEVYDLTKVFYHGDKCPDGKCASWVIWRLMKEKVATKEFHLYGVSHGHNPPDVSGDVIAILDFCFPKKVIIEMAKKAKKIYILDHHASTERELAGKLPENVVAILDNSRSGSEITWDWVYPGIPRPWFLEVISDRDLFRWTRPYSKKVTNAMFSNGYYTWEKLEQIFEKSNTAEAIDTMIKDFCLLFDSKIDTENEIVDAVCSSACLAKLTTPKGEVYTVKMVQCPRMYKSEVGNKLSKSGCDFAVLWQYDFILNEWWVSCRASSDNDIDLSKITPQFHRGGGHPKSAGFTIYGSKANLLDYFQLLTMPPSRKNDLDLVHARGDKYSNIKIKSMI